MYACSHSGQIMLLFVMYVWDYNYCTLSPICVKTYNMHYDCFIKWLNYRGLVSLTQWDPDDMDDIPQISFTHAFLQSFRMLEFSYNFHWRQSLNDNITISQLRLRLSVVAELYPSHYPKRRWPHLLTHTTHACICLNVFIYIYMHTYAYFVRLVLNWLCITGRQIGIRPDAFHCVHIHHAIMAPLTNTDALG